MHILEIIAYYPINAFVKKTDTRSWAVAELRVPV